jgi:CubicO group peptidase (beta-lactamase class C family)
VRLLAGLLLTLSAPAAAQVSSVAVEFDRRAVRPVLAEGLADRVSQRAVTADDPVRVASISKLFTALGVMRLVDAGVLDLDRDVSEYLGWPLRHPAYPDAPITLRMLLSHRSGLSDGGERYIVPLGETLRARLQDARVWDPLAPPGSDRFAYTNLNFPVVASVMEAATGERFDRLVRRTVFAPLGVDACFNWSGCSTRAIERAVVLYRADGSVARDDLGGQPPQCMVVPASDGTCDLTGYRPGSNGSLFSPQGGVRISMRDLAKVGRLMVRQGRGFISRRAFMEMTDPAWRLSGDNGRDEAGQPGGIFCAYGLAVHRIGSGAAGCRDDLFGDGRARIGHSGEAYGLRSGLWLDPRTGKGIAFFTTAVPEDAPKGASGFTLREEELVRRAADR